MSHSHSMQSLLDFFRAQDGSDLQVDETAILAESQREREHQSMAIKILSVFGGILGSLTFLGFLGISGLMESSVALLLFGAICISTSVYINKTSDKIILDTVCVSFFLIGFALLSFGLSKLNLDPNTISLILMLVGLCSLYVVQNYILSLVSILIINACILWLILGNEHFDLMHLYVSLLAVAITFIFLQEAKIITSSVVLAKIYNPLRIGLVISFLLGLMVLGKRGVFALNTQYIWLASVPIILSILYVISHLFETLNITKTQEKTGIYAFSVLILLPTAFSPAISGAMLVLLLSFLVNYKTGFVLGVVSFIYFVSQYYYDLHFTLLTKSMLMIASGLLFIGVYLFTRKKLISHD